VRYRIELLPSARRELASLPPTARRAVAGAIDSLGIDPRPTGASRLQGIPDTYRIRAGDHRVLYQVLDARVLVLIIRVGHRRDVYRRTDLRRLRDRLK
jgi:mRNA interferase RelE/StbE